MTPCLRSQVTTWDLLLPGLPTFSHDMMDNDDNDDDDDHDNDDNDNGDNEDDDDDDYRNPDGF